ncbi:MAG: response regulator [Deltaproteobacteria bacterium]|nr:response regulator [Deltaproteobacteria bacterium]
MIRWSIEQTLRAAGYEVALASSASEGLALMGQLHPGVVFLDLRLPDGHGLSLLKRIKDAGEPKPAVIVMTAFAEDCTSEEALRLGAYAYLNKPFDFYALEFLVDKAMQARSVA